RTLLAAIREIAAIAEAAGLVPAVHPHAGTYVEFADEIEAVADAAPLCLDTGHLAFAGLAADEVYARFAERVVLLHLKDVDPAVRARAVAGGLGYWEAVAAGIFCPVGRGCVAFAALAARLREAAFAGWGTVEQDRVPGGDPVADLVASREALEALGMVA
ncbi:MAG TPA: TIM barrel protein, partial [Solirubrobacteraceae bacterium]